MIQKRPRRILEVVHVYLDHLHAALVDVLVRCLRMPPRITRILSLGLVHLSRHLHPRRLAELQLGVELQVLDARLDHLGLLVHVRVRARPKLSSCPFAA